MIIYHVTTESKAKKYRETGHIISPVRGFNTLEAAMAWAIRVGRKVIYEVSSDKVFKLPDHHSKFGDAYWIDENVKDFKCVLSPKDY